MPTFASNWYWVGAGNNGVQWFIDNDSVIKNYRTGYATLWLKSNNPDGTSSNGEVQVTRRRFFRLLYLYKYDANKNVTSGSTINGSFIAIPPDSVGEAIYYLVWGKNNSLYNNHDSSAYTTNDDYRNVNRRKHPDWYPSGATI